MEVADTKKDRKCTLDKDLDLKLRKGRQMILKSKEIRQR